MFWPDCTSSNLLAGSHSAGFWDRRDLEHLMRTSKSLRQFGALHGQIKVFRDEVIIDEAEVNLPGMRRKTSGDVNQGTVLCGNTVDGTVFEIGCFNRGGSR